MFSIRNKTQNNSYNVEAAGIAKPQAPHLLWPEDSTRGGRWGLGRKGVRKRAGAGR